METNWVEVEVAGPSNDKAKPNGDFPTNSKAGPLENKKITNPEMESRGRVIPEAGRRPRTNI